MKTYDSERIELNNWIMEKRSECLAAERQEKPKGFDSKANHQLQEYVREYNRKLTALKKKYHID